MKKALMQHVVATLRARLDVVVSAPAKTAGLSDDEQAGHQLASAVSSALQGADSPQAVRDSVQEGLQEAASSLQGSGASGDDLGAALSDLTTKVNNLLAAFTPSASTPGTSEVAAAGARVVTKEKGVLEIRTQEGDIVKVKFATKTDVRAGVAQISTGDQLAMSSNLSVATRSRTQLSVEGDLNAEELQAIAQVVQKVDALANDFFAGNVDEALARAADLDIDTEQLANVALRLSRSQRIDTHAVSIASSPAVAPPAAPSVATPASADVPAVEPEAAAPNNDAAVVSDEASATAPDDTAAAAAPAAPPATTQTPQEDSPQAVIAKFVARMMVTFHAGDTDTRVNLSFKMKLQLLTAAIEAKQPEATPAAEAGVKKLCDVAETAAVQA